MNKLLLKDTAYYRAFRSGMLDHYSVRLNLTVRDKQGARVNTDFYLIVTTYSASVVTLTLGAYTYMLPVIPSVATIIKALVALCVKIVELCETIEDLDGVHGLLAARLGECVSTESAELLDPDKIFDMVCAEYNSLCEDIAPGQAVVPLLNVLYEDPHYASILDALVELEKSVASISTTC